NPQSIRDVRDLARAELRLIDRQEGAGSRLLLHHLLRQPGIDAATLHIVVPPARSETDVALAIQDGKADVGFGIAAVARQCRLGFVPVQRERYDIAVGCTDYLEPPFHRLLAFARTPRFLEKAAAWGGYDVSGLGRITYNSP